MFMNFFAIIFMLIIYLGFMALALWIGYLINKLAVKKGTIEALTELKNNGFFIPPMPPKEPPHFEEKEKINE